MKLFGWRNAIYGVWIIAIICIHFGIFPALIEILERPFFEFGSYHVTAFFLLTSVAVLLITGSVSSKIVNWADICSRSSGLTFLTAFVVMLGVIATIDLVVAFMTQKEPFILAYLFGLLFFFLPN